MTCALTAEDSAIGERFLLGVHTVGFVLVLENLPKRLCECVLAFGDRDRAKVAPALVAIVALPADLDGVRFGERLDVDPETDLLVHEYQQFVGGHLGEWLMRLLAHGGVNRVLCFGRCKSPREE